MSVTKKRKESKKNILENIRKHCVCVPITASGKARKNLEKEMRTALANRQEFLLYFQPEIDISTMQIVGWEALLRWQHPEKGLLSPDIFIPVAEESGLILPLGDLVIEQALFQIHAWMSMVSYPMTMAVNVSMRQFENKAFVKSVMHQLAHWHVPPALFELELTESLLMKNPKYTLHELRKLSEIGVHMTIDDFGTGFSSFGSLVDLPIYKLKIDRSFIHKAPHSAKGLKVMEAMVKTGHLLGMKVVIEGAETAQDFKILKDLACDYSQGYYTGRPMDETTATDFLEKNVALRAMFFRGQLDLPFDRNSNHSSCRRLAGGRNEE